MRRIDHYMPTKKNMKNKESNQDDERENLKYVLQNT